MGITNNTKFFFDHVPKNAGSSIRTAFIDALGSEHVSAQLEGEASQALLSNSSYRFVSGHFWFKPMVGLPLDRVCLTALRDPVDRFLSLFHYVRNYPDAGRKDVRLLHELSLDEITDLAPENYYLQRMMCNPQAKHYAQITWDGKQNFDDDTVYKMACTALENFDFVGVQENLGSFLTNIFAKTKLGLVSVPWVNRGMQRQGKSCTDEQASRIRKQNEIDLELFQFAQKLQAAQTITEHYMLPPKQTLYRKGGESLHRQANQFGTGDAEISHAQIVGEINPAEIFNTGENVKLRISILAKRALENVAVGFQIKDIATKKIVFGTSTEALGTFLRLPANQHVLVEYPFRCDIGPGDYEVAAAVYPSTGYSMGLHQAPEHIYQWRERVTEFLVRGNADYGFEGMFKLRPLCTVYPTESGKVADSICHVIGNITPALTSFDANIQLTGTLVKELAAGDLLALEVSITNTGETTWPASGSRPIRFGYHWEDELGERVECDELRTDLPKDIKSSEQFKLVVHVKSPDVRGNYSLQIVPLQEHVRWFEDTSSDKVTLKIL